MSYASSAGSHGKTCRQDVLRGVDVPVMPGAAGRARPVADLAALGPYFAIDVHSVGSPLCPPWQALEELISAPDALAGRIGEVRERLAAAAGRPAAAVEFRVAASIAQLGLCARLLSPVLGAAAAGRTLVVDTGQARWIPALGGPFRLSLPDTAISDRAEAGPAAATALLAGPVAQVVRAVEAMSVSPRVLWGNVASAVNGAAAMIAAARPDLATAAGETAAAMLQYPALTGTYQGRPLQGFRRRNCCLIYRLSPSAPAYCGDCVL
jgi:FhuF-like iron-sulfur protein